jgi:hypothetical protein
VIDNSAFLFQHLWEESPEANNSVLLTEIRECNGAVLDLVSFFNFRYLALRATRKPRIIPLSSHAKTSVIAPLKIGKSDDILYFFHNPDEYGDPVRIASSGILPATFYGNTQKPVADVSVFCDHIPAPAAGNGFSLFTVIKRVLIALTSATPGLSVRFLVPEKWAEGNSSRWLNATVAFRQAELRLYTPEWEGSNFIVIEKRAFVFSHGVKDEEFRRLGFHWATNSSSVVARLNEFWNDVWENATSYVLP